ncbi:T9SS type A sorting domain-containing protein [Kaistella sp.]|uniref:T9SS type A sorting domain-containing protein n=4 Tax=Kaistella sp. TaxID=2782235 RepID=UPI002F9324AD
MRKKLPLLLLAALPMLTFAQSAQSKVSVHPKKQAVTKQAKPHLLAAPVAYCTPALDCTDGDLISNVTFAGINNTTTCSPAGYGDYTSLSNTTTLLAGESYPIAVTVGDGWPNENVSVWIDYNKNDLFETSEFTYVGNVNTVSSGLTVTGNIPIAAGTANGSYRMRVRVAAVGANADDNTLACDEEQGYGETEDYTLIIGAPAPTGCLTATNGQYPAATFTPNCNGAVGNITTVAWLNEYSKVNVIAGTTYTFSTSVNTYFITIGNEAGTAVLASGTGSVTYTPIANGIVRFYSHLSSNCDGTSSSHTRSVKCGTPPPPPTACTDFKTPSNNRENGGFFGGDTAQRLAIDIPVGSTGFTVHGIEPIVAGDATTFSFKFYSNNAGLPGTEIATRNGIIQSSVVTGTAFNYEFKKYTVAFDSPIDLTANTTYWVEVTSDAVAWESASVNRLGAPDVFNNNGTSGAWVAGTTDYVFNLVCSPLLAVGDASNAKFSYYPNPVVDYLNISSSTKVESVSVYNIAGQKMPVSAKLVNGKVDMSKLAPGVYIITTTLDGGKNESFKVVKK